MNVYKISCYSRCGSYFREYLKSVTVIADSPEEAKLMVKASDYNDFIYPENKWDVEDLGTIEKRIIDYERGTDY